MKAFLKISAAIILLMGVASSCSDKMAITVNTSYKADFTPSSLVYSFQATEGTQSVQIATEADWSLSTTAGWVTIGGEQSGNGNGTFTVTVGPNSGDARDASVDVTTTTKDVIRHYSYSIHQEGKPAPVVVTTPIAEWDYSVTLMSAADQGTWLDPASFTVIGDNGKYLVSHTGNGKLYFYNASDKTAVGAPATITKTNQYLRGQATASNPFVAWVWKNDYYLFEGIPATTVPKGSVINVGVTMKSSNTSMGYWRVEFLDGDSWVTLGDTQDKDGTKYSFHLTPEFASFSYSYTLTNDAAKCRMRVICVGNWKTSDSSELTAATGGSTHLQKSFP